jgi:hypothetical protein
MPVEIVYFNRDPKSCKEFNCPLKSARERFNPKSNKKAVRRVFEESNLPVAEHGSIIATVCRSGNNISPKDEPCGQFYVQETR